MQYLKKEQNVSVYFWQYFQKNVGDEVDFWPADKRRLSTS